MIKKEEFTIRTIEQNDIEYIHSLNNSDFRGEFQEFQFESKNSLMKQFESDGMCSDRFQMLVVEKDNLIIGLIYISFVRTGLANIGLVICENQRAKNLGTNVRVCS